MLFFVLNTLALASEDGEAGGAFSFMHMWNESGFIAKSVIVMLFVMLLWSCVVTIERLIAFNRARSMSKRLAAEVREPIIAFDQAAALAIVKDEQFDGCYLGNILEAGLGELNERWDAHGIENAENAIDRAILTETGKMRRGMTILATVGSTAPFVGLFGTTFGVINAFAAMGDGTGGLSQISTGISEALITTGVGIGVAVVGVWMFNYFNGRIEKVQDEMHSSSSEFLEWANKHIQTAKAGK